MSGPDAAIGNAFKQGELTAVKVINANGGVLGKPVNLVVYDDGGNPTKSATLAENVSAQNPDAVQPGTVTAEISAAVPILAKEKLFVSQGGLDPTLNNPQKYPYTFGNAYQAVDPSNALATQFASKGYKKIALLTSNDVSGTSVATADKAAFAAKGMSLTVGFVPDGSVDATPQLEQVLATHPDALLLDAFGAAAAPIIKARAEVDPKVPTYGGQSLAANNLSQLAPASSYAGLTLMAVGLSVSGTPETKTADYQTFYAALKQVTAGTIPFSAYTYITPYNDIVLAADAANLAKSYDPQKMSAALESATQLPMYLGPVSYSATNHNPIYTPQWWAFIAYGPVENGLIVPATS